MSVIERLADIPAKASLEKSASANKRAPEKLEALEHEIREQIRRDVAPPQDTTDPVNNAAAKTLNDLIGRVSGASMREIDLVISELQTVRSMLRKEGERVSREIAGFASLNHASMSAMKVIGDSIKQWQGVQNNPDSRSVA